MQYIKGHFFVSEYFCRMSKESLEISISTGVLEQLVVHGQNPLNPWNKSRMSGLDSVHVVHANCPGSPKTMSSVFYWTPWTFYLDTLDIVHGLPGHFPWTPQTLSMDIVKTAWTFPDFPWMFSKTSSESMEKVWRFHGKSPGRDPKHSVDRM